mgnify:CR=1 FL=1
MNKYKVLIVDDIPENIQTLGEMIKDFDLDVKIAEGGQEAIDIIDSYTPDIILLDLMMPEVNGWDVIEHVRARYDKNEMIIIITSLLSNKDNIDECYEMGVNDYVAKPIIPGRIISSVETQMRNVKYAEYEPKAEQHQLNTTKPASVVEMD